MPGDPDDWDADALKMVDDRLEFGRFAALRNQDRDVAARRHAKVAVDRLGEVQEGGRRAGRGESRGDLTPDMPRLAEPADDHLPLAVKDQVDCVLERLAQTIGERIECAGFVVQDSASELEDANWRRVVRGHGVGPSPAAHGCEALDAG